MRVLAGLLVLAAPVFAAEPVRDVAYVAPFYPHIPKFDKGYLLENPKSEVLIVYGRDGARAFATTVRAPQGGAHILDAAVDQRGGLAVSFLYFNESEYRRGGIAYLDASGTQIRSIETGHFLAAQLCFEPTGELWTFGEVRTDDDRITGLSFRKYTNARKEMRQFRFRSPFPMGEVGGFGSIRLQSSDDKLGALIGAYHENPEWVEYDFLGKLLGYWRIGNHNRVGLTADGELYALGESGGQGEQSIVRFDRGTSSWVAVKDSLPPAERYGSVSNLIGADENLVVVNARDHGRLLWMPLTPGK